MSATLHLPNTTTAPPKQWRYKMPETGQDFGPSPSLNDLLEQLRSSYRANGYDIPPNLTTLIEAYICNDIPEYCTGDAPPQVGPLSLGHMLSVTYHTVLAQSKRLLGATEQVPLAQAEKRASVCVTCSENVSRADCSGCHQATLRNLIIRIVGSRGTSYDDRLQVCRICLCENRAKVHLSLARLRAIAGDAEFSRLPAHCWMVTESQSINA